MDTAGQVERFMKRVSAKEQLAPKPEAPVKPTKKERRARARGDMRSGMRGMPTTAEEAKEPVTGPAEPAAQAAEPPGPEAIMIEPTPAGRVWEPVSVEPVEAAPAVELPAAVSQITAESEASTPKAEAVAAEPVETMQDATPAEAGAAASGSLQTAEGAVATEVQGPRPGERPPRPRNRPPRASTEGQAEGTQKPRPPRPSARGGDRKPRSEKPPEPSAEQLVEPPTPTAGFPGVESNPPGEGTSAE